MSVASYGGPAFPVTNNLNIAREAPWSSGMSLLDYYAGIAMPSAIADAKQQVQQMVAAGLLEMNEEAVSVVCGRIATMSFDAAAAMVEESVRRNDRDR